jgi:hypothetical protein
MIGEFMNDKTKMGKELSQQKPQIRILKDALNSIGFAHEHGQGGELFADELLRDQQQKPCDVQASLPRIGLKERQVVHMFYNGHYLLNMCSIAELRPDELFRVLQSLIVPTSSQLPYASELTAEWHVAIRILFVLSGAQSFCFPARCRKICVPARTFRN